MIEEEKLFGDRYRLKKMLGRGNFSEVWLAVDTKINQEMAIKIYAPATGLDDDGLDVLSHEFALVLNANHKNLLKPIFYDTYERKPYLTLPYCKNGSIAKLVGRFNESEAWRLLRDVASGLAYLHAMTPPVIHQDIKPDNILLWENGTFMITDFGISTRVRTTLRQSTIQNLSSAGTIAYMAPERFGKKGHISIMASDIYSLGATVFEMITGDAPFGEMGGMLQLRGAEIPDLPEGYSEDLCRVVNLCLQLEPWERPVAAELEVYADRALKGLPLGLPEDKKATKSVGEETVLEAPEETPTASPTVEPIRKSARKPERKPVEEVKQEVDLTYVHRESSKNDSSTDHDEPSDPTSHFAVWVAVVVAVGIALGVLIGFLI